MDPASHSVEDMAALYQEIRTIQPVGPYFLRASLGGKIALEMAQQLHAQGEKVAMLVCLIPTVQVAQTLTSPCSSLKTGWQLRLELKRN